MDPTEVLRLLILLQAVLLTVFLGRGMWLTRGALSARQVLVYRATRVLMGSYALVLLDFADGIWIRRHEVFNYRLPVYALIMIGGMYGITTYTRMQRLAPRPSA
jgi:hypothetical protein